MDKPGRSTILHRLVHERAHHDIWWLLHSLDLNAVDADGATALVRALFNRDPVSVKLLLQAGADVNACGWRTVLCCIPGSENDAHDTFRIGTRYSFRRRSDELKRLCECMRLVLEHGATLDRVTVEFTVALKYKPALMLLFEYKGGLYVDSEDIPLILALFRCPAARLRALADLHENSDWSKEHLIAWATMAGCTDLVETLLKFHPEMLPAGRSDGASLLHMAVMQGDVSLVETLLRFPVDVNAGFGVFKRTPLWFATKGGHLKLAQMLTRKGALLERPPDEPGPNGDAPKPNPKRKRTQKRYCQAADAPPPKKTFDYLHLPDQALPQNAHKSND